MVSCIVVRSTVASTEIYSHCHFQLYSAIDVVEEARLLGTPELVHKDHTTRCVLLVEEIQLPFWLSSI
jgi:hypothetical protein